MASVVRDGTPAAGGGTAAARALLRDASDPKRLAIELPDGIGVLASHDFSLLRAEKLGLHMPGTRGWVVAEAQAWLNDAAADKLFWLMGGAGTGKTVVSALLLDRLGASHIPAAHHFCLHTNPDASQPELLRAERAKVVRREDADAIRELNGESFGV